MSNKSVESFLRRERSRFLEKSVLIRLKRTFTLMILLNYIVLIFRMTAEIANLIATMCYNPQTEVPFTVFSFYSIGFSLDCVGWYDSACNEGLSCEH